MRLCALFGRLTPHAEQKALGMSMRVERSTLEEVQERFSEHRRRKEEQQRAEPSFQARVACAEEEEERQRAARRERKLQKKVRCLFRFSQACCALTRAPAPRRSSRSSCRSRPRRRRV